MVRSGALGFGATSCFKSPRCAASWAWRISLPTRNTMAEWPAATRLSIARNANGRSWAFIPIMRPWPRRGCRNFFCDRFRIQFTPIETRRVKTMGLIERRKMKELQEETLPGRVQEIAEICGRPIPYDVDWESFADDIEGLNYLDNISCHRLNMALRVICQDELGKSAVRNTLKQVKLKNVKDQGQMRIAFDKGTLEMNCAYALGSNGMFNDNEIRVLLEKYL